MSTADQKSLPVAGVDAADARAARASQYEVWVGVDAGRAFHKMVARRRGGARTPAIRVDVSRAGFVASDAALRAAFPRVARRRFLVGIEFAGPYGYTFAQYLERRGYAVVSVRGTATSATRELDDNSPEKNDAKDAAGICNLVRAGVFVPYRPVSAWAASLRVLTLERERLGFERMRLINRLSALLDTVWPEFCATFPDLMSKMPHKVLAVWAHPAEMTAQRGPKIQTLLRTLSRGYLSVDVRRRFIDHSRDSIGLRDAPLERRREIARLLERYSLLQRQLRDVDGELATLFARNKRASALLTVPSVSVVCAATIVAELGDVDAYESPRQVIKMAGLNLTRRQSGTSVLSPLRISKHGRRRLRRQLYMLAARWCTPRGLYRPQYEAMKARNGGKGRKAIVAIARKMVPMLLHVMQSGEAFDASTWLAARHFV